MKPKAVIWDIDDVLTPTSLTFYRAAMRTHGKCLHPDEWKDYLWGQHISMDEGLPTQEYLIQERVIETCEPYDYTEQALALTARAGYKNILLSARGWHPDPIRATQEWAARYVLDPYIHGMYFVLVEVPKYDALKELQDKYDIHAFVEDNPVHACAALELINDVYLLRRGWNQTCPEASNLTSVDTALCAAKLITRV